MKLPIKRKYGDKAHNVIHPNKVWFIFILMEVRTKCKSEVIAKKIIRTE
jgi:hypothetical protein